MKKVIIAYSTDIKNSEVFLQFKEQFEANYSLDRDNLCNLNNFPKIQDDPFAHIVLIFSIDFYLENKETITLLNKNKGNRKFNFFIVIGTGDQKKVTEINFDTSLTLVPDQQLHDIFHKVSTQITPNLEDIANLKTQDFSKKIVEVATILGSERNIEVMMNKILTTCMEIADADAGSLAVLGFDKQLRETEKDILTFYVSKNNSKEIHFNRFSMKIDLNSLAGYSIIKKTILNIPDAYNIPQGEQYHFNDSFDSQTGFKTKSILVIPMVDSRDNIIGVIQLLNKKKDGYQKIIDYDHFSESEVEEFSYANQESVLGIANIASVLLRNQLLYNQVNDLLENFVKASVYAVEQRDPATSGHSERVATYSVGLAKVATEARGVLEDYCFNPQQIRELRYAALLHDFGKIAIREKTLVKANKLEDYELENIFKKIRIYLLNFQLVAEQKKVELFNSNKLSASTIAMRIRKIDKQVKDEIQRMHGFRQIIVESNVPRVIEESVSKILEEIQKIRFFDDGEEQRILSNNEFKFLNIKRGSLSTEERLEIEGHVTQSYYFLQQINWISGLKTIPEIAYGHHEKLDGMGYPRKLHADQILPQTKIMTVCDIYDALTAADRPYKKALSPEKSIQILYDEVSQNKIDRNLVDIFVKKKIFLVRPGSTDSE